MLLLSGVYDMSPVAQNVRVTPRPVEKYLTQVAIVFAAYLVAGKLGQATTNIRSGNIGPVWPAYGVALAAILLWVSGLGRDHSRSFSGCILESGSSRDRSWSSDRSYVRSTRGRFPPPPCC